MNNYACLEPPTRLEIRDTSPSRPISDQQMMMSGNSKHSDPSMTYMGPYSEGQNVTLVCSAYGGNFKTYFYDNL